MAKGLKKRAAKRAAEQDAAVAPAAVVRARTLPEGVTSGEDTLRLGAVEAADTADEAASSSDEGQVPMAEQDKKDLRLSEAAEKRIKTAVEARKSKKAKTGAGGEREAAAAASNKRGARKSIASTPEHGAVVYLGHIPYGFFERQMTEYFAQFGEVTRLRISRSMWVRASLPVPPAVTAQPPSVASRATASRA